MDGEIIKTSSAVVANPNSPKQKMNSQKFEEKLDSFDIDFVTEFEPLAYKSIESVVVNMRRFLKANANFTKQFLDSAQENDLTTKAINRLSKIAIAFRKTRDYEISERATRILSNHLDNLGSKSDQYALHIALRLSQIDSANARETLGHHAENVKNPAAHIFSRNYLENLSKPTTY